MAQKQTMSRSPFPKYATRSMYCPQCESEDRPRSGSLYVAYRKNHGDFMFYIQRTVGKERGISPHLLFGVREIPDSRGNVYQIKTVCALHYCGVKIELDRARNNGLSLKFGYFQERIKTLFFTRRQMEGLYNLKTPHLHLDKFVPRLTEYGKILYVPPELER